MKHATISILIAAAALALLPGLAAAQCEGGTSTAGYYLRNGTYVAGGCADTSTTTPGQLYPSGAQTLPSTNPAAGMSALPGQPVATGLLPVRAGDLDQPLGALGAPGQNLGPGAGNVSPVITLPQNGTTTGVNALPGQFTASGLLPVNTANVGSALGMEGISNGITNTVNNGAATGVTTPNINGFVPGSTTVSTGAGTSYLPSSALPMTTNTAAALGVGGPVNGITSTRGLPNTTAAGVASGLPGAVAPGGLLPNTMTTIAGATTPANVAGTTEAPASVTGTLAAPASTAAENIDRAPLRVVPITPYGYSLQPAPAAPSTSSVSPAAPSGSTLPPVPGRGGPTFIGEDSGSPNQVIISTP